jgi:hypothetical protein
LIWDISDRVEPCFRVNLAAPPPFATSSVQLSNLSSLVGAEPGVQEQHTPIPFLMNDSSPPCVQTSTEWRFKPISDRDGPFGLTRVGRRHPHPYFRTKTAFQDWLKRRDTNTA